MLKRPRAEELIRDIDDIFDDNPKQSFLRKLRNRSSPCYNGTGGIEPDSLLAKRRVVSTSAIPMERERQPSNNRSWMHGFSPASQSDSDLPKQRKKAFSFSAAFTPKKPKTKKASGDSWTNMIDTHGPIRMYDEAFYDLVRRGKKKSSPKPRKGNSPRLYGLVGVSMFIFYGCYRAVSIVSSVIW